LALEEEKKERDAALSKAQEVSRKVVEEATLLRERTMTVEEAASKVREEAVFYKDAVADLDKEKGLLSADLTSARESFEKMKAECVRGEIARSAAEEAKKKALEDLEAERVQSRSLSDDVKRLKRALLEKDGAIAQAGKAIEDLWVANTDLDHSHRECRCFPHRGSHQRVNLYACSHFQMVMQKDTKIYPGSGKRRPYVQQGRRVCIILHLSACTGVNTSVVWNEMEYGSSTAYECYLA